MRWLERRRRWQEHHTVALARAKQVHSMVQDIQVGVYDGPGFTVYYAQGPTRAAWDTYCASMESAGEDPWKHGGRSHRRFVKALQS